MSNGPDEADPGSGASLLAAVDRAAGQLKGIQEQIGDDRRSGLEGLVAAAIAHEISNVLTPVRAYSEHALLHLDDRELVRKALARSAEGAARAVRAAEAILELARGKQSVPRATPIAQAVASAAKLVEGIQLTSLGPPSCTAGIGQIGLEQVFVNLFLNARAAAGDHDCRVEVRWSVEQDPETGSRTRLEVHDQGSGIPSHLLGRIFQPLVSHGPRGRGGSGLGLTICKFLVEAVGGSLSVRSQVGAGTCFMIDLPGAEGVAAQAA